METDEERQKRLDELHRLQTGMVMKDREDIKKLAVKLGAKRICPKCGFCWDPRTETCCTKCGTE